MSRDSARAIKRARTKAGLTSKELSQRTGVPHGYIRALEADLIGKPDVHRLEALALELGIEYPTLLAQTNQLGALEGDPLERARGYYISDEALQQLAESAATRAVASFSSEIAALSLLVARLEALPTVDLQTVVTETLDRALRTLAEQGQLAAPDAPVRQ